MTILILALVAIILACGLDSAGDPVSDRVYASDEEFIASLDASLGFSRDVKFDSFKYVLDKASQTRFLVFDADDDTQLEQLVQALSNLSQQGIPAYLESSRRGAHLWLFFKDLVAGKDARLFGKGIANTYSLQDMELFPKQDSLQDGPGSLIRLPFGIHRKSGKKYGFTNPSGEELECGIEEQILLLSQAKIVSDAAFDEFWRIGMLSEEPANKSKPDRTLRKKQVNTSDKIKASVSAFDFISMYVTLSAAGRGLCPFHTDANASFSVNIEKNYWKCFAGCGGGSIIDFWMMWRNCDFKEAIGELEIFLL